MLIPVNNVVKLGIPIASTYFDTTTRRYVEGVYCKRVLPEMDCFSCDISNTRKICTVVGRCDSDKFVVSFGSRLLAVVLKRNIRNASNIKVCRDGRIVCIDGRFEDLSDMFPEKDLLFVRSMSVLEDSSDGMAEKFLASYKGNLCIAKFRKVTDKELCYEKLYYDVGKTLGVSVCRCILSVYSGRMCSLSFLEYSPEYDSFTSLKSLGMSVSDTYNILSNSDKMELDRQLVLDYLMSQQDRHMGNIALCNGAVYPMYDNGECLGLGSVGYFSGMYRKYIERCNTGYLRSLINFCDVRNLFKGYESEYSLFLNNWRRLWKIV